MNRRALSFSGLALALAVTAASAAPPDRERLTGAPVEATDAMTLAKAGAKVSVIVKFDAPALASYKGGLSGLEATSPEATGAARLDTSSRAARAYQGFLAQKELTFENAMRSRVPGARIVHRFRTVIGGVSVVVPVDRVKDLSALPGVKAVYPDVLLPLDTNRSPEFIGAPTLWGQVGGQDHAGEGVIIGMLDTGIWPEHPSVADDGSYSAPDPAKWHGTRCDFGSVVPHDAPFACNNKLIGAARFMATFDAFGGGPNTPLAGEFLSARDNNGHGSHTATTAGGNANVTASTGATVSGIAPRAYLSIYKVCFTVGDGTGGGSCYTSDSAAAIEQAILDGVDVLSFSVGGGANPYSDAGSLAFLDAYKAGVFIAAAAGNSGPGLDTTDHREPWVTTVAATTDDKGFHGSSALTSGGGALGLTGISSSGTDITTPDPVVLSATAVGYADDLCLAPAPAGSLTGKIVACKRGNNARVAKSANVAAGGAVGMILYNAVGGATDLDADIHAVPTLHIDSTQGTTLVTYLNANADALGTITGGANDFSGQGDVTASFSSRGGPNQTLGVSKPDVAAPGVNILAAETPFPAEPTIPSGNFFQIISGTSMATPHVAGTGALLRQLHPSWSPGQIKSALMMTATTANTKKENGTTPTDAFDVGSGRIDLTVAGNPGLTISDSGDNYLALSGNLATSNYPSLYIPVMAGHFEVQRTLKSVDAVTRTWQLSVTGPSDLTVAAPTTVSLAAGASQAITISVDASSVPVGQTRQAILHFTSTDAVNGNRSLVFPIIAVRKQGAVNFNKTCTPTTLTVGGTTQCTVQATNTNFQAETPIIFDAVPSQLTVTNVTGASRSGNLVFFQRSLGPATAPQVSVAPGSSPDGYLPLSALGVAKNTSFGDDTMVNFTLARTFLYAGQTYNRVGVSSNGIVVVGGGTAADATANNQSFPNPTNPNNVLAPFWTDLNPSVIPPADPAGVRVATLTDNSTTPPSRWLVVDFQDVPNFSSNSQKNSFQIWIGENGVEDISFTYGANVTTGDQGNLTVGAENFLGNSGQNVYYNGTGTAPTSTTELVVTGTPAVPGETHTITIDATGANVGAWTNCAEMVTPSVLGEAKACVSGVVTRLDQTITFDPLPDKTFGDPDFSVDATASSGLPVNFTASGQCTVTPSGSVVHLTGVGACTITAHQPGNASYNAAPDVARSFTIKPGQTITFDPLPDKTYGDPDFSVHATASSGLPVSFTATGQCTVTSDGSVVHLTDVGSCTITAHQAGDATFGPAPDVSQSFDILAGDLIYANGFESGDLSGWSSTATDNGDLSVSNAAGMVGNFGLQAVVNDTNSLFVQDERPSGEGRFRARFYFDAHDFDPGVAQGHLRSRIFLALQDNPSTRQVALVLKLQGGVYSIEGRVRQTGGVMGDTGFFTLTPGQHYIEFDWQRASAPGVADGSFQLWLDGTSVSTLNNLDNGNGSVDTARLGALSLKGGASGTLYFDQFESHRQNPVGP